MATEISRSLKEINEEVVKLDKNIRSLSAQNRGLDRSLRLDPTSTSLLAQKTQNLQQQISLATQKVNALREAQKQMKLEVEAGNKTAEEYNRLTIEIAKAEAQVKSLNAQLIKTNNVKLKDLQANMQKVANLAKVVVGSIVGIGVAYAAAGDKIADASERYRISAEEFQRNSFIFDRATINSESYVQILEAITMQMAALERGSSRAVTAFSKLGLSMEDVKGKSPAQVVDMLIGKLRQVADEEERAALASVLLGARGVELAQVAGLTADQIKALNLELEKAGILTQEEAEKAGALQDSFDNFALSMKKVIAQLGGSLIPLMEALLSIASIIIPVLATLADIFKAIPQPMQIILAFLLTALIVIPKIISLIQGVNAALIALGANPINLKIIAIAAAVAMLILLLVELAKWIGSIFGKKYDMNLNANLGGSLAYASGQSALSTNSYATHNVTNYYDYSTINNTVTKEADIDDIAEQLSTKIRVGGGK